MLILKMIWKYQLWEIKIIWTISELFPQERRRKERAIATLTLHLHPSTIKVYLETPLMTTGELGQVQLLGLPVTLISGKFQRIKIIEVSKENQEELEKENLKIRIEDNSVKQSISDIAKHAKLTYLSASSLSDDRWICPICLDIFDDAVETPCCHNLFWEKWIRMAHIVNDLQK